MHRAISGTCTGRPMFPPETPTGRRQAETLIDITLPTARSPQRRMVTRSGPRTSRHGLTPNTSNRETSSAASTGLP